MGTGAAVGLAIFAVIGLGFVITLARSSFAVAKRSHMWSAGDGRERDRGSGSSSGGGGCGGGSDSSGSGCGGGGGCGGS